MHTKEHAKTAIGWRHTLFEIIFEADTPAGKGFDVVLLLAILLSVFIVMLESVQQIESQFGDWIRIFEWVFTILFTLEYFARILCIDRPIRYIFSFFGVVDLLSILPTYLSLVLVGSQYLLVIRTLRLLRVFRILKLVRYIGESRALSRALLASRAKITVFMLTVMALSVIFGTVMYLIEGNENGFTSIPKSIYWCIVTLTTVGYGDIAPQTTLGQTLASFIMILGYAIIAVPTGIVTVELAHVKDEEAACPACQHRSKDHDAIFCKYCGLRFLTSEEELL